MYNTCISPRNLTIFIPIYCYTYSNLKPLSQLLPSSIPCVSFQKSTKQTNLWVFSLILWEINIPQDKSSEFREIFRWLGNWNLTCFTWKSDPESLEIPNLETIIFRVHVKLWGCTLVGKPSDPIISCWEEVCSKQCFFTEELPSTDSRSHLRHPREQLSNDQNPYMIILIGQWGSLCHGLL